MTETCGISIELSHFPYASSHTTHRPAKRSRSRLGYCSRSTSAGCDDCVIFRFDFRQAIVAIPAAKKPPTMGVPAPAARAAPAIVNATRGITSCDQMGCAPWAVGRRAESSRLSRCRSSTLTVSALAGYRIGKIPGIWPPLRSCSASAHRSSSRHQELRKKSRVTTKMTSYGSNAGSFMRHAERCPGLMSRTIRKADMPCVCSSLRRWTAKLVLLLSSMADEDFFIRVLLLSPWKILLSMQNGWQLIHVTC